jgi:phage tail-like protein
MTDTTNQSSYVRYLPPVLWEGDNPLLRTMLRVFEKLLTGIDDGVSIQHGDHEHEAIEAVIAQIYQLFDPWHTPYQFLDWLASWVDLELPSNWSEFQRRNAIAQIVPIYRQRGLKDGLHRYLELYIPAEKRPRIAIDDGSRVLFMQPQPEMFAQISTLVGQKPYISNGAVLFEGPVSPQGIALAPDGSLFLCDIGAPQELTPTLEFGVGNGIWRVLPFAQNNPSQTTGQPQRVGPPMVDQKGKKVWSLDSPMAIAVDNLMPWNVYVLSGAENLYQFTSKDFTATPKVIASQVAQGNSWKINTPVAMVFDTTAGPTNGHLLILDRGSDPASGPSSPKIVDINVLAPPLTITTHPLTNVVEPLSLALLLNGDLIIGDGGPQNAPVPANLMHVDRSTTSSSWTATPLFNVLWAVLYIPSDPTDKAAGKYENITTALTASSENGYTLTAPGASPAQSGQPAQSALPVQLFLGFDINTQVATPISLNVRIFKPVSIDSQTNKPEATITFTYSTAQATDPASWPRVPAANIVDNTQGLQQEGTITITPPADWASQAPTNANQQPPQWAAQPATPTDQVTNALFWLGITIANQIPATTTAAASPVQIGISSILFNPQNPLIAPVALVRQDDVHLYVLDLGLKPYEPAQYLDPNLADKAFLREMAEPAVIYSVELGKTLADIGKTPLSVRRASEQDQLIYPVGMVQDQQGILYIADQGEYFDPGRLDELPRVWRTTPHEFGVAIHFSQQRLTTAKDRSQIMQTISQIINLEKPAHTNWATVYAVDEVVKSS